MENEPLTAAEAGALLRLSVKTVRKLISSGELAGRSVGGRYRTTRAACIAYIECPSQNSFANTGGRTGEKTCQSPNETEYGTVISLHHQAKELDSLLTRGTKNRRRSSTTD